MNANTKALAEKSAKGKGLNAEERALLIEIMNDPKELKAYGDHMAVTGKKVEKLTVEMLDGQGRFGRYMKVTVPGSYKSLNMGKRKFERFMSAVKAIGYNKIIEAYDNTEPATWELEVTEAK